MLANPKPNQPVRIHYGRKWLPNPLHGRVGEVVIVSKGKPRNHGIKVDGKVYVIPCGNLMKVKP